jgi:beta-glucosidase-like glycosyl hydrolase
MTTPYADAVARVQAGTSDADTEAAALVAQLTDDELLGCLDGDLDAWPGLIDMMQGGYHRRTFPGAAVERLGIPGIQFSDGPRGCVVGVKTAFPVSMARGASFDTELERRIGRAIATELRTVGATYYGGVCVNLLRHPGWGRAQETYGEEPHLVGEMGLALAEGAQEHVMACVKHFAVNSMENARFAVDVQADERALHEVYLPHFRRIVEGGERGGAASVMSAYNALNGAWCGEHRELLTDILRGEWGFTGFVTSDFIFGLRDAVQSVIAGLDIEMPFRQQRMMHLPAAFADGRLPRAVVEESVTRTVATLIRFQHVIDRPVDATLVDGEQHRALAREASAASVVVLRNEQILPLDASRLQRVAVVGRLAAVKNLGDKGSSDVIVSRVVTPLDGLRAALPHATIEHSDRDPWIAEGADVAIVVVGTTFADEGEFIGASGTVGLMEHHFPAMTDADREAIAALPPPPAPEPTPASDAGTNVDESGFGEGGDRRSLRLSSDDEALVQAVAAANPATVVVLMGGSATVMEAWRRAVPGIVVLWYPGVEGGHALADVLLGHVNPSGRLPFTIPTDEAHLPHWDPDATTITYDLWHGHWKLTRDGNAPAFPFGFGLSYTTFRIEAITADERTAEVRVINTGHRDGHTVVQVYGGLPGSVHERPAQRLVGFARVHVPAGATVTAEVPLQLRQLDIRSDGRWLTEAGTYVLAAAQYAGDSDGVSTELAR